MKRNGGWWVAAAVALLLAPVARGVERDGLLEEVRGLRRDLHAVAVAAQRIQLLVYRMHAQTEVVRRAKEVHDRSTQGLVYLEFDLAQSGESIQKMEEKIRAESDGRRKEAMESGLESARARRKANTEALPKLQAEAAEARRQWELEQAKIEALQARLDQLERQLEGLSAMLAR